MVCGRPPFIERNVSQLIVAQTQRPPPRPRELRPELPEAYEAVILKALEKDPDRRFQSMAEFKAALSQAAGGGLEMKSEPLKGERGAHGTLWLGPEAAEDAAADTGAEAAEDAATLERPEPQPQAQAAEDAAALERPAPEGDQRPAGEDALTTEPDAWALRPDQIRQTVQFGPMDEGAQALRTHPDPQPPAAEAEEAAAEERDPATTTAEDGPDSPTPERPAPPDPVAPRNPTAILEETPPPSPTPGPAGHGHTAAMLDHGPVSELSAGPSNRDRGADAARIWGIRKDLLIIGATAFGLAALLLLLHLIGLFGS
jgi:serine/threonine-protein kinase